MRRLFSKGAALVAAALLLASPALAHRGHDAMSVVTLDSEGHVTVSHRFESHDIEPALVDIAPDAQPSLDDPDAMAALERYLVHRFSVSADGTPVALTVRHTDIGASEVRIDLEGTAKARPRTLELGSTILLDVYPGQVNQVVVRAGETVRTLRFAGSETQVVAVH